jgi:hypothetical protein
MLFALLITLWLVFMMQKDEEDIIAFQDKMEMED